MSEKTGYPSIDKIHLQGIPAEMLNPEIYPLSILATFLKVNEGHLDEIAVDTISRQYTKQEIKDNAVQYAAMLMGLNIKAGDKVVLIAPNCIEGIILITAANAIGVKIALLDPAVSSEQTDDEIEMHQPVLAFVYGKTEEEIAALIARHVCLCYVVDIKDGMQEQKGTKRVAAAEKIKVNRATLAEMMEKAKDVSQEAVMAEIQKNSMNEEPLLYLQTSGSSSGRPKTLPFTNRAIFAALIYASNSTGTKTRDTSVNRVLCVPPYQHGYGWMTMFVNLMGGNQVVLAPGATPKDIGEYYKYKTSYIYGSPLIMRHFMDETPEEADLSALTAFFCAGFAVPEEWFKEAEEYFAKHNSKAEIRNNYGISEGLCIGTASDGVPHRAGTIGKFYVGPEWLLVDEDLNEVKYGEPGELIVHAESLCQGYFNDPKATEEAFIQRDGKTFYRTGDYMSLAEDGYVSFVGRKKRFYQPIGVADKVNCETIEQAIAMSRIVKQTAVVVAKDPQGIEGAKAFIVLNEWMPSDVAYKEISEVISEQLLPYQMPRWIRFVDEIPLLNSGKVNYMKLEKM